MRPVTIGQLRAATIERVSGRGIRWGPADIRTALARVPSGPGPFAFRHQDFANTSRQTRRRPAAAGAHGGRWSKVAARNDPSPREEEDMNAHAWAAAMLAGGV